MPQRDEKDEVFRAVGVEWVSVVQPADTLGSLRGIQCLWRGEARQRCDGMRRMDNEWVLHSQGDRRVRLDGRGYHAFVPIRNAGKAWTTAQSKH